MPSRHSKRLGEAELEIMQILWSAQAPLTARQILQQLGDHRTWALSTLMTALSRLGEKGFVRCDRSTRTNLYTPTLSAQTYQAQEGQSFLARLYGNSLPSLVASLYDSRAIGKAELQELRDYLSSGGGCACLISCSPACWNSPSPQVWSWRFSWPFPPF